jgi:hypothetical protein
MFEIAAHNNKLKSFYYCFVKWLYFSQFRCRFKVGSNITIGICLLTDISTTILIISYALFNKCIVCMYKQM